MGFNDKYIVIKKLQEGSHGVVYLVRDKNGKKYAVKKCENYKFMAGYPAFISPYTLRELAILQKNNPHAIKMKDYFIEEDNIYIVLELADFDGHSIVEKEYEISNDEMKRLIFSIIKGVQWFHSRNILHRDIKPENILVVGKEYKLCDFALCGKQFVDLDRHVQTIDWRAPELLTAHTQGYDKKIDYWSLGITIHDLWLKTSCTYSDNIEVTKRKILNFENQIVEEGPKYVVDSLCKINPDERVEISEILKHEWFSGLNYTDLVYEYQASKIPAAISTVAQKVLRTYVDSVILNEEFYKTYFKFIELYKLFDVNDRNSQYFCMACMMTSIKLNVNVHKIQIKKKIKFLQVLEFEKQLIPYLYLW